MRIRASFILATILSSISMSAFCTEMPGVIYGEDNRRDIFRISDPKIVQLTKSIAGMTLTRNIDQAPNSSIIDLLTVPYGIQNNLCKDEIYYNQPTAMACTGFLIAPDLIATAGHCAQERFCTQSAWIFDFTLQDENDPLNKVKEDNIYYCKRVVVEEKNSLVDYGIIKLDRPVKGRPVLKLNLLKNVTQRTPLFTLGYPSGLPLKLTDKGNVRAIEKDYNFFTTDLDSFGGNSGSPVFNANTNEVEGILVRGESDFEWDSVKNCRAVKRCTQADCKGEDVSSIHFVTDFLKTNPFRPDADVDVDTDRDNLSGIGAMNGCTATWIQPTVSPKAPAYIVTNGHCVGRIPPNEKWIDKKKEKEVYFLSPKTRGPVYFQTTKVKYGTMTGTDLAVLELNTTQEELLRNGIRGFQISSKNPEINEQVTRIGLDRVYHQYDCLIDAIVSDLRESRWNWVNSYRHFCESWGGTSGSPLVSRANQKIVAIHNTANEGGTPCAENSPCEVDQRGNISSVPDAKYAQQITFLTNCFNDQGFFDLNLKGCNVDPTEMNDQLTKTIAKQQLQKAPLPQR